MSTVTMRLLLGLHVAVWFVDSTSSPAPTPTPTPSPSPTPTTSTKSPTTTTTPSPTTTTTTTSAAVVSQTVHISILLNDLSGHTAASFIALIDQGMTNVVGSGASVAETVLDKATVEAQYGGLPDIVLSDVVTAVSAMSSVPTSTIEVNGQSMSQRRLLESASIKTTIPNAPSVDVISKAHSVMQSNGITQFKNALKNVDEATYGSITLTMSSVAAIVYAKTKVNTASHTTLDEAAISSDVGATTGGTVTIHSSANVTTSATMVSLTTTRPFEDGSAGDAVANSPLKAISLIVASAFALI